MITWIIIIVLYIASVLFCRWINYYAYIRGIDTDVVPGIWITPFFNILGIIIEIGTIKKYYKWKLSEWGPIRFILNLGNGFLDSLVGNDWEEKRLRREIEKKYRKQVEDKYKNENRKHYDDPI